MKNKKILIIDDESSIREMLEDFLKSKGCLTISAQDGVEALSLIEKELPHLIICDLLLPREHGVDIVRNIKNRFFIPVIIISGVYKEKELKESMEQLLVEDFFSKPIALEEIYEKICEILER